MSPKSSDKFELMTADGKKLSAIFYSAENPSGWLIFIHMMPATKESWSFLAGKFLESGYSSVAFDLRGHGESEGGPQGYKNFSDKEHQSGIKDAEAAWEFLKSKGAVPEKTFLIGASIGANLALQFLAGHPEFKRGVLLSAGLDYRGVRTEPLAGKLHEDQGILLVSSRDDGANLEENLKLLESVKMKAGAQMLSLNEAGHGTDMLSSDEADVPADIIEFIKNGNNL